MDDQIDQRGRRSGRAGIGRWIARVADVVFMLVIQGSGAVVTVPVGAWRGCVGVLGACGACGVGGVCGTKTIEGGCGRR
jgi:hypothetical protein